MNKKLYDGGYNLQTHKKCVDEMEGIVRMQAEMFALVAEMHSEVASIEAMKAANQNRIDRNETIAYDESCFLNSQIAITKISTRLREL